MITQAINLLNQLLVTPVFAQINLSTNGNANFAPLENLTVASIVSGAISLVMLVVTLVFFFMLVLGGLKWVMSGGDQKAVEAARSQITNALIGLAIVFAAWAIMQLINIVFGVNIFGNGGLIIPTFKKS